MKPLFLTKDSFYNWDDTEYPNELMIETDNPKELADQILKNQEDAVIVKRLKKLIEECDKFTTKYELQKILGEG